VEGKVGEVEDGEISCDTGEIDMGESREGLEEEVSEGLLGI
jgi:hypothetical protein